VTVGEVEPLLAICRAPLAGVGAAAGCWFRQRVFGGTRSGQCPWGACAFTEGDCAEREDCRPADGEPWRVPLAMMGATTHSHGHGHGRAGCGD